MFLTYSRLSSSLKRRYATSLNVSIPTLELKPFEEDTDKKPADFVMGVPATRAKLTTPKLDELQGRAKDTNKMEISSTSKTNHSTSSANLSVTNIFGKWKKKSQKRFRPRQPKTSL